jgi:hypothetical protein
MKPKPRNIDVNGKTRPTTTTGIASPKDKGSLKEAEGIIKGGPEESRRKDDAATSQTIATTA